MRYIKYTSFNQYLYIMHINMDVWKFFINTDVKITYKKMLLKFVIHIILILIFIYLKPQHIHALFYLQFV